MKSLSNTSAIKIAAIADLLEGSVNDPYEYRREEVLKLAREVYYLSGRRETELYPGVKPRPIKNLSYDLATLYCELIPMARGKLIDDYSVGNDGYSSFLEDFDELTKAIRYNAMALKALVDEIDNFFGDQA